MNATKLTDDVKEDLHDALDRLKLSSPTANATVHALIDLGIVTALTCAAEHCRYPGTPFNNGGRRNPVGLSIDHIQLRSRGGSDRPENLRLKHYACNAAWNTKEFVDPKVALKNSFHALFKRAARLQRESYGTDVATLEGEELAAYLRTMFLAMHTEMSELLQELNWKTWKPGDPRDYDREKVLTEFVDILFFWMNIAVALRITGDEFVETYLDKYEENELRQVRRTLLALWPIVRDQRATDPPGPYECCDRHFPNWRGLQIHRGRMHKTDKLLADECDPLPAPTSAKGL